MLSVDVPGIDIVIDLESQFELWTNSEFLRDTLYCPIADPFVPDAFSYDETWPPRHDVSCCSRSLCIDFTPAHSQIHGA